MKKVNVDQVKRFNTLIFTLKEGSLSFDMFLTYSIFPMYDNVKFNLQMDESVAACLYRVSRLLSKEQRISIILQLPYGINDKSPKWMQEGELYTFSRWCSLCKNTFNIDMVNDKIKEKDLVKFVKNIKEGDL